MITIVLADHHLLIREGVRSLLETKGDFKVVGEVADGLKVVGLVQRRKPRVFVIALAMPGLNSFEAILRFGSGRQTPRSSCSRCTRATNTLLER